MSTGAKIRGAIVNVKEHQESILPSEIGFVDSDFHPGNVVYGGTKMVGLIDLDSASSSQHFEDLGFTLMMLCRDFKLDGNADSKRFSRFANIYSIARASIGCYLTI